MVLGLGLKIGLGGMLTGIRFSESASSLSGVLSPAVQKLSLLELLAELKVLLLPSGLAGVKGKFSPGLLSTSESLLLSLLLLLLLLLLSVLLSLPLPLLLEEDELAGLYLFNFSLIFGMLL